MRKSRLDAGLLLRSGEAQFCIGGCYVLVRLTSPPWFSGLDGRVRSMVRVEVRKAIKISARSRVTFGMETHLV